MNDDNGSSNKDSDNDRGDKDGKSDYADKGTAGKSYIDEDHMYLNVDYPDLAGIKTEADR